ncbi:MAG: hypothetical protein ABIY37_14275 [Devosia sp.]
MHFLEEQLAALIELRADGHFSDIVSFAQGGSRKASRLMSREAYANSDRFCRLARQYRDLVTSLVH